MICPACAEKAVQYNRRDSEKHYSSYRYYRCKSCLTEFKTEEKIMFSSLPKYIRTKFLEEGKRS